MAKGVLFAGLVAWVLLLAFATPDEELLKNGFVLSDVFPTHYTYSRGMEDVVVKVPPKQWGETFEKWMARALKKSELGIGREAVNTDWCPSQTYFDFIPQYQGAIFANKPLTWTGDCFQSITASLTVNDGDGFITITTSSKTLKPFCSDFLMFGTREHAYFKDLLMAGTYTVHIKQWEQFEPQDIALHGMFVFSLPCGAVGTAISLQKTYTLFDSKQLEQNNVDFLRVKMNWTMEPFGKHVTVDKKNIRSGDYLAILRLDGLDPLVMFGTGGHTGHSAIAVWDKDELYVCESTDANPFGPVYWPPPYGVIRTPFDRWYQLAINASYHVGLLPLASNIADKFDETAFWSWFNQVEGLPYGYHNFLYSFLDTYPLKNLPAPITSETFTFTINAWARLINNNDTKVNVYSMIIQGLNKRLDTSCGDLTCVNQFMDSHNTTLAEVMAIPEQDEWVYSDGHSMVCSVFAFEGWKAGLSAVMPSPMQGTEQTPKDNYQAQMFDPNRWNESNCPGGVQTTENGSYCQLLGPYVLTLPGYNSIPLYAHMNERCPSEWPGYERCPADKLECC